MSHDTATTEPEQTSRISPLDLVMLVMVPAILAHELTHAIVAWRWLVDRRPSTLVDRLLPPRLALTYGKGTPVLVVLLANLAPTIVGIAVVPLLLPHAYGLEFPLFAYGFGSWFLYTLPSKDDLAVLDVVFRG